MTGRLFPADDGWFEWHQQPAIPGRLLVRFTADARGRLEVSDLRVTATDGSITSAVLRAVPIGRIEAAANAQVTAVSIPDTKAARRPGRATRPSGVLPEDVPDPGRRGRSDGFYAAVAATYQALAHTSSRPAWDIAEANGVPVTTVHRWVKEARRRGLLGPGRPGKAG